MTLEQTILSALQPHLRDVIDASRLRVLEAAASYAMWQWVDNLGVFPDGWEVELLQTGTLRVLVRNPTGQLITIADAEQAIRSGL